MMYASGTIMGAILLNTNRYMTHWFQYRQIIHSIVGSLFGIIMLWGMIIMWHNVLGGFGNAWHSFFGYAGSIVVLVMCPTVTIALIAEYLRQFGGLKWDGYGLVYALRKTHKYATWFVLFGSQAAAYLGAKTLYLYFIRDVRTGNTLIVCNYVFVFLVFVLPEIRHQIILRKEDPWVSTYKSMTIHEFERAVKNG